MLRHEDNSEDVISPGDAALRVPTEEFIRALAEIDAHRARQIFDQAGTLTLAEVLQEYDAEGTPEELAEEVQKIRAAGIVEAKKQKQRRRLKLILCAELASVLLSSMALLSLSRTIYNPQWQASRQVAEVKNMLRMTQGQNPSYQIFVVPATFNRITSNGSVIISGGIWANSPAYPLSMVPDGYNIHHFDSLDDNGHTSFGDASFMPASPAYFEFREVQKRGIHEGVSVFYNGLCYRRGWIRKSDIPNVFHGQPFFYYPEPVDDPQDKHFGLAPLTLSNQSIAESEIEPGFVNSTGYDYLRFIGNAPLQLDEHAWETF